METPNNTRSFRRNWPGSADGKGKPYPASHTPGVGNPIEISTTQAPEKRRPAERA